MVFTDRESTGIAKQDRALIANFGVRIRDKQSRKSGDIVGAYEYVR